VAIKAESQKLVATVEDHEKHLKVLSNRSGLQALSPSLHYCRNIVLLVFFSTRLFRVT
jgi:hypothetical protein